MKKKSKKTITIINHSTIEKNYKTFTKKSYETISRTHLYIKNTPSPTDTKHPLQARDLHPPPDNPLMKKGLPQSDRWRLDPLCAGNTCPEWIRRFFRPQNILPHLPVATRKSHLFHFRPEMPPIAEL
ncbi:hypothetical protein CDAR_57501 [Caerostris darwini]|uniref:Uncharacterized protein n=1 Tax=Caerostris darwini TaxID=1538125 RepID=A0AAV4SVT2_9ARAC|nr:hypothetical protein CDAR_57501 [Caerostris darwini]